MDRAPVSSNSLASVGYEQSSLTLEIEFPRGAIYQYFDVPVGEFHGLMQAESHGRYFITNIKDRYRYTKL